MDISSIYEDYSVLLLIEFISTEINLNNFYLNFYYKDVLSKNSKLDFYKIIEFIPEEIHQEISESCSYEKIQKFISFIEENVLFKWNFQENRRLFNEYYFSSENI